MLLLRHTIMPLRAGTGRHVGRQGKRSALDEVGGMIHLVIIGGLFLGSAAWVAILYWIFKRAGLL